MAKLPTIRLGDACTKIGSGVTEMIETELLSLHEGNFARYAVRPYEFREWQEVWNAKPEPRSSSKSGRRNKAGD